MEEANEVKQEEDCVSGNDKSVYVPSQVDRKKASFMYILLGIFIYLSQNQKNNSSQNDNSDLTENPYISYHIRQSIGIWTIIFVSLPVILLFSFIPVFRYLVSFMLFLLEVAILVYSIKISWDGRYLQGKKSVFMFFYKFGDWVLNLFA